MNSPGKYIAAGVFIGLLMFKPSFGVALGNAIGTLSVAAFENQQPQQIIEQPVANLPDDREDREAIFSALEKIINRLDALEMSKPAEQEPAPKEGTAAFVDDPAQEARMDAALFDAEFDKKFKR